MTDVKVSIVIACYNEEHFIAQCLDSMISQTLREIEIIVVDDGSTDASLQVIQQYALKDHRIIAVQGHHDGAGKARNLGMKYAHGKYITFFDADDFAAPDCYQIMYDNAEKSGSDVCVVGSQSLDNETGDIQALTYTMKKGYLPSKNPFSSMDIPAYIFLAFNGWAWDKLFLFSFIQSENIKFQEIDSSEDMLFVDKALLCANSIYVHDDILITHRINKSDSVSSTRDLTWDCFYKALIAMKDFINEKNCNAEVYLSYSMWAAEFIHWQLSTYHGAAFIKAYNLLHDGGLDQLDFLRVPKERFDSAHKEWYDYCAYIHQYDLGHYLDELWKKSADQNEALNNRNRENNALVQQLNDANKKMNSLNNTCEDIREELKNFREKLETSNNALADTKKELEETRKQLGDTKKQLEELQRVNSELQIESKEERNNINELTSHISDMKNSLHWKIGEAVLFIPQVIHQKLEASKLKKQ